MAQVNDGLNALREAYPFWAFWHVNGRLGAIHRKTGVIIDAPEHAAWKEILAAADAALGGGVVTPGRAESPTGWPGRADRQQALGAP